MDTCMVCLESKPDILQNCGHKVQCLDCFEIYMKETHNKNCIVCRNKISYVFIY